MAKWTFAESQIGQTDQGPNNSTAEHFKSHDVFSSLVRESIQNSLDVPLDPTKPVEVQYAFGVVSDNLSASLKEVESHVAACYDMYQDSSSYRRMVEFLMARQLDPISYLRVSDYNTQGMRYKEDDIKCGFYSFVQSVGNSSKETVGSGGSYGFGKAAYYEFSNSRTMLVSSKTADGAVAFQGCSMLCTHKIDGKKYSYSGFFDNGNGMPIQDEMFIPEELRRDQPGSDIYLLHVHNDQENLEKYQNSIIESVLLNFWMAIYAGKLVVTFDWEDDGHPEVVISQETLESLMNEHFPSMLDDQQIYSNPRPYYEAVKNAIPFDPETEDANESVYFETRNLDDLYGHMKFYLMRNIGTRDRYLRMRKPLMVIDAQRMNGQRGISGVLICDGSANDYLSKAEPPAHDKWELERVIKYKEEKDTAESRAYHAITHMTWWCRENVKSFFASKNTNETEIEGLDSYLYATEDTPLPGNGKAMNGQQLNLFSDEETGAHTTEPEGPAIVNPNPPVEKPGTVTITIQKPQGATPGGDTGTSLTGEGKGTGTEEVGPHSGSQEVEPRESEPENETEHDVPQQQIKPVTFRSFAKSEYEGLVYTLCIHTNETLEDADIFVSTKGEDSEEEIPIVWAQQGEVRANAIHGVDLYEGANNKVLFRFEDNIKHLISLTVYVKK